MAPAECKGGIYVGWNTERMLQYYCFASVAYRSFGALQVHIVGIEPTIDVYGLCAGVPDRIRHHYMSRHLEQHLVSGSNSQGAQYTVERHSSSGEAVGVLRAHSMRQGSFIFCDRRSIDQTARIGKIASCENAVFKGCRAAQ